MQNFLKSFVRSILCAAATAGFTAAAAADNYPSKPVRMIVGFAPGGGTDTTARPIAQKLGELLGQQVIVDNRPGAGGNIATDIVSKSNPDGYTILMGTIAALAINPGLYSQLPFDPEKDLAPVTQAVDSTNVLSLHPSVAAGSVKELIALAKTKSLSFGSSGVGGTGHLAGELFNVMAGTKLVHIPYKGGGPAMIDLVGGQVSFMIDSMPSALPRVQAGRLRALATTGKKRFAALPDVPTLLEAGLAYETTSWWGIVGPAGLPQPSISAAGTPAVAGPADDRVGTVSVRGKKELMQMRYMDQLFLRVALCQPASTTFLCCDWHSRGWRASARHDGVGTA